MILISLLFDVYLNVSEITFFCFLVMFSCVPDVTLTEYLAMYWFALCLFLFSVWKRESWRGQSCSPWLGQLGGSGELSPTFIYT